MPAAGISAECMRRDGVGINGADWNACALFSARRRSRARQRQIGHDVERSTTHAGSLRRSRRQPFLCRAASERGAACDTVEQGELGRDVLVFRDIYRREYSIIRRSWTHFVVVSCPVGYWLLVRYSLYVYVVPHCCEESGYEMDIRTSVCFETSVL